MLAGLGSEDEERLVSDLFFGYNKLIRPVENMTRTVTVQFGLAFIQLIHVVSKAAILLSEQRTSNRFAFSARRLVPDD